MSWSPAQLHENTTIVAAAQTRLGRLTIFIFSAALLWWNEFGVMTLLGLAGVMLAPQYRRLILSLAAGGLIMTHGFLGQNFGLGLLNEPDWGNNLPGVRTGLLQVLGIFAILYCSFFVAKRFEYLPVIIQRNPLLTFHTSITVFMILLATVPGLGFLAAQVWAVPYLMWRLSYLFQFASRGKAKTTRFRDHLFYLYPAFEGDDLPVGKGLDYLTHTEAGSAEALARSQLAGLKVLILSILWYTVLYFMEAAFYNNVEDTNWVAPYLNGWRIGLPDLNSGMDNQLSLPMAWFSLYLELLRVVLQAASYGHLLVGCLRLYGFNVFRWTYKPLLAESILDFWNRFLYYFKELCVEFFFYPVFLSCSWAGPRLRLFLAVFAAAFLGNMYYHIYVYPKMLVTGDIEALWATWGPRLIYCFFLAIGIWISMLRQQSRRVAGIRSTPLTRARSIFGVLTYYAVIHIWNVEEPEIGFVERFRFMISLIGL